MVRYEVSGHRATITIDEPDRRNPLSVETMEGLAAGVRRALVDPVVRVIVFTGEGTQTFSAGGDMSRGFVEEAVGLHRSRAALADLFRAMWRGGKPTVARVNGHAFAGGFGLAVACDITVCVEDAKLGVPEINVGLWPMMITAALVRAMPRKAALELMLTGRTVTPEEARSLGAVTRVVPRAELDSAVDEVVEALAAKSPAVLEMGRDAFFATEMGLDLALDRLHGGLTEVAMSDDSKEGIAAFLEKRPPVFRGR